MNRNSSAAAAKRDAILLILGRRCVKCGAKDSLEFDVIRPVGEPKAHHQKMCWLSRMNFYCRQLSAGNLQVLCSKCNGAKAESDEQFWLEQQAANSQPALPMPADDVPADCPF